jgi:peptidoglycan/xylan/chitin deacetylase (PgdA/CDA1 family)
MRFCFHSVMAKTAASPEGHWVSSESYVAGVGVQSVHPEWFNDWCGMAHNRWGDDLVVTFDDGFRNVLVPAVRCVGFGIRTIVFISTAYIGGRFPYSPYEVLTEDELLFLAEHGVEVGSHGYTHEDMRVLKHGGRWEFIRSLEILGNILGKVPTVFAPPHGLFDMELIEEVKRHKGCELWGTHICKECMLPSDPVYPRALADMDGYIDYNGDPCTW